MLVLFGFKFFCRYFKLPWKGILLKAAVANVLHKCLPVERNSVPLGIPLKVDIDFLIGFQKLLIEFFFFPTKSFRYEAFF